MLKIVASKHQSAFTLCNVVEKLILENRLVDPAYPDCASVFVAQAFSYQVGLGYRNDGVRGRIIERAAQLGILIEEAS